MTKIFLYGEVDIPSIPSELLLDVDTFPVEKFVVDIGYGKVFEKNNILKKNSSYAKWTIPPNALTDWIKSNVPPWPDSEFLTIQKIIPQGLDTNAIFPVHHDIRRMFALNYIISTGGKSVTTSWFKDVNQPVIRSLNKKIGMQSDTGPVNYAEVELLDSIQCEVGKWYLISTNVLHDVDHVDSSRSAVTIPYFNNNIVQELKNRNLFKTIKEINC